MCTYLGLRGGGGLEAGPVQCYVSWKPSLKPSSSRSSRTFGGRSSPSERRHLSHPARPPRVPAAFEWSEMSGAKKLGTVSRCGGKRGRGSGETGLRFKLSSESRKVCVRGAFNGRDSKPGHWCGMSDLKHKIRTAHSSLLLPPLLWHLRSNGDTKKLTFSLVLILDY